MRCLNICGDGLLVAKWLIGHRQAKLCRHLFVTLDLRKRLFGIPAIVCGNVAVAQDAILQANNGSVDLLHGINPLEAATAPRNVGAELFIFAGAIDRGQLEVDHMLKPHAEERIKEMVNHEAVQGAVKITLFKRALPHR